MQHLIQRRYFRKTHNYGFALISECFRPVLQICSRIFTSSPTHPKMWRKGLLIGSDHIGDILYRSSSLPELVEGLPKCKWYIVAAPPADQILKNNPYIAGVINHMPHDFCEQVKLIRSYNFDTVICYGSPSLWKDLILSVLAGIPNRVAYGFKGFSGLITHPVKINFPQPFPFYFRDLVLQLTEIESRRNLRPLIYADTEDKLEADELWNHYRLDNCDSIVACFLTSRQPTGIWPADSFGHALALIKKHANARIVLCGATGDYDLLKKIDESFNLNAVILAGKLGLRSLYCLLKKVSLVLTSDSGPRHIANATDVPVFFLRNILFSHVEAGPYTDTETDLAPPDEYVSNDKQLLIFEKILPEMVANKLISALTQKR